MISVPRRNSRAIPYGRYDLQTNTGAFYVGSFPRHACNLRWTALPLGGKMRASSGIRTQTSFAFQPTAEAVTGAARTLGSIETILNYLATTTTRTGLSVRATLVEAIYERGSKSVWRK